MFDAIDSGQLRHAVCSGFCDMLIVSKMIESQSLHPRSLATGVGSIDLPSSLTGGSNDDRLRVNCGTPATSSLVFSGLISSELAQHHLDISVRS